MSAKLNCAPTHWLVAKELVTPADTAPGLVVVMRSRNAIALSPLAVLMLLLICPTIEKPFVGELAQLVF
jgi:hypothetical protein